MSLVPVLTVLATSAAAQLDPQGGTSDPTPVLSSTVGAAELEPAGPAPLSWDLLGGGIPQGGVLGSVQTGFSSLTEVRLELPLLESLLVGAWLGIDLGYWTLEGAADDGGVVFGVSGRYRLLHNDEWSIGLRAAPGGRVRFEGGGELLIPVSARALYVVDKRFLLGAAVDVPIRLGFPSGANAFFALPSTFGVAAEVHLQPSLALTAVLGLGPALDTRGVELAFRATVGIGYRL